MKPTLKAPGIKLKYNNRLSSNIAFKIKLRRYNLADVYVEANHPAAAIMVQHSLEMTGTPDGCMVGRCRLRLSKSAVKAPAVSAQKL
jgi:hypothetical protein